MIDEEEKKKKEMQGSEMISEVTEIVVAHWLIDEDRMNSPMKYIKVVGNVYANPELDKHFASQEIAR